MKSNPLFKEMLSILAIALSLLLLISIYTENGAGALGSLIRSLLKGLFGFGAYALPFIIIAMAIYVFLGNISFKASKMLIAGLLFICLVSLIHIIGLDSSLEYTGFFDYIKQNYIGGSYYNGGLIGAVFGNFLVAFLGKIGTYIFLTAAFLILGILITGKSAFNAVRLFIENGVNAARESVGNSNYNDYSDFELEDEDDVITNKFKSKSSSQKKNTSPKKAEKQAKEKASIYEDIIEFERKNINKHEVFVETAPNKMPENKQQQQKTAIKNRDDYKSPPIDILISKPQVPIIGSKATILENSRKLEETLKNFGISAKVIEVNKGPTVTRYEIAPGQGVKVSKISNLADDLALSLAATGIRIEAPVPGKSVVGIEVPNKEITPVLLREVLESDAFINSTSKLLIALGKDIAGNVVVSDIATMPHLLIAGATGSGKSVCINTFIISILYNASPDEVKILMIDPKVVELNVYNGIPHLLIPVVTEPKKAAGALNWAVSEMNSRYKAFAEIGVRDLKSYNQNTEDKLPQIVIIIDELSDLMMACSNEVEDAICRLAQMARAAGIHLIIATQRPSVDVITGLIKANIPSRLAFSVTSGIDSRTILDMIGAEKLLGKGDMLFNPVGFSKPLRIQGAYVSDKEVENVVSFFKNSQRYTYDQNMIDKITSATVETELDEAQKASKAAKRNIKRRIGK